MAAGRSALDRGQQLLFDADDLAELSRQKRQEAINYLAASASETELAGVLRPLVSMGWTVLEDRRWPGSKQANVDFILVGPGGVAILDAKSWSELVIRDGSIFRGDAREDDEVAKLASLVDSIADGLQPTGLTAASITAAMVFANRRLNTAVGPVTVVGARDVAAWLTRLPVRLGADDVDRVIAELDICCPAIAAAPPVRRGLLHRSRPRPREIEPVTPSLFDTDDLAQAMMDAAMAGPIEQWMTFLHPDQNKLVRSQWNGPARVRGPAGTGKTVIGLHRAIYLAQRSSHPVLFVSFVRTLPVVLSALAHRLSPAASERIEFHGVHQLAVRCLQSAGQKWKTNPRAIDAAFRRAWISVDAAASLGPLDERPAYWQDEIAHVIKGRGITEFDDYRTLQRIGRKTPMRADDRKAMWDLYLAYEDELHAVALEDFNDLLIRARLVVETYPDLFRYSSVIVDEVQDLNLVAMRFLRSFAGDDDSGQLLLIGDGQQSVYPGGFALAEAGISVAGRAAVLRHNYRNTVEILDEARRIVSSDTFDDLDGVPELGERDADATRRGYAPVRAFEATRRGIEVALTRQIQATHDVLGTPWGNMAVLVERLKDVEHYGLVLERAGIPHVELTAYDGVTLDRVKIGTIKRAKGLEFTFVLLPGLSETPPELIAGETAESYAERCERWRRELYVAMTRARDGLWLGYLA